MNKINLSNGFGRHTLKIISLIAACILWFYVLNSEPLEVEVKSPLNFILPKGLAVKVVVPEHLKVQLKGARAFVKNISSENLKVFLDINKFPYKRNKFTVKIKPSDIPAPFGVEILKVVPDTLELSLEKEIKKMVPVHAKLVGELPNELKLVSHEIEPREVMIYGPRSIMKTVGQLLTVPIDQAVLEGENSLKVSLEEMDSRIKMEKEDSYVDFSYVVRTNTANLTLKKVKIQFLTSKRRIFSPSSYASLDVLVPNGKENVLTEGKVKVIAEIPEAATGRIRVKLNAELPEGIHLLRIHPEFINVSVPK